MLYEDLCEDVFDHDTNYSKNTANESNKIKNREYKIHYHLDDDGCENKNTEDEYYCPFKVGDYVRFINNEAIWKIKSITIPKSTVCPSAYADLESYLNGEIKKNVVIYSHFMRAKYVEIVPQNNKKSLTSGGYGFGFECSVC